MSGTTLRIIIAGVFLVHGVGHVLGFFPAFRLTEMDNWTSRSWLLTPLLGETIATIISVILFGASLLGFIAASLSIMSWLIPPRSLAHPGYRVFSDISNCPHFVLERFPSADPQQGGCPCRGYRHAGLLALAQLAQRSDDRVLKKCGVPCQNWRINMSIILILLGWILAIFFGLLTVSMLLLHNWLQALVLFFSGAIVPATRQFIHAKHFRLLNSSDSAVRSHRGTTVYLYKIAVSGERPRSTKRRKLKHALWKSMTRK